MKKERIIKYGCLAAIMLIFMFAVKSRFVGVVEDGYNEAEAEFSDVSVAENSIEQYLTLRQSVMNMNFLVKNVGTGEETVKMELWSTDGSQCYKSEDVLVPVSVGDADVILSWDVSDADLEGVEEVILKISATDNSETVYVCVQDETEGQVYVQNGSKQNQHVRMSVIYGYERYMGFFILFGIVLFVTGGACLYAWEHKLALERLFVVIALAIGVGMALIVPFGQEPDGISHFTRAMDVSYGNVLAPFYNNAHEGGYNKVPTNFNDIDFQVIHANTNEGSDYTRNLMNIKFDKESELMPGECGYTSLFYAPQALGILIGRVLNLSIYMCMVLGRILNLLCYVALAYWALKKMPIYRNLLAVIALLPMTLYQAASFSPDAMLNGLCFLFIALCFYYAYGEEKELGWKHVIGLGVLLALLFACKYIYICLGLLVFLIPKDKFKDKKTYWKSFGIAILPIVFILAVYGIKTLLGASAVVMVEAAAGQMTQIEYVKGNPLIMVKLLITTVRSYFEMYAHQLNTLGWLNYPLPILKTIVPCFMVAVACLDTEGIQKKVKGLHKVLFLVTGGIIIVLGMVGLYLMDAASNPVGSEIILGYQTRYAIPCMVILLALFTSEKVENKISKFSVKVVSCMGIFLIYTVLTLVEICY